ncbi:hypothetical protein [Nocardioides sp. TF02-7]|uniref:hypothetical protein n=1 Tax=Nocardioides sp. TF02-7 TaxID=2917724 RepID=UPI001F0607F8|nr:hypothetical protein [Nocardioides sp. TF02-7]UMG92560.1 hypothetical protein MF408_22590 [Nocardioides sp. TF02-7]
MKLRLLAPVLALPLVLTACGDDGGDEPAGAARETAEGAPDEAEPTSEEAEIRDTLVAFTLEPRCDLATDDYLVERALLAETPAEACTELEDFFVEPAFEADDIAVTDIVVEGDVATAELGSDPDYVETNISVTYELMRVDGTWRVSGDSFTSDDL